MPIPHHLRIKPSFDIIQEEARTDIPEATFKQEVVSNPSSLCLLLTLTFHFFLFQSRFTFIIGFNIVLFWTDPLIEGTQGSTSVSPAPREEPLPVPPPAEWSPDTAQSPDVPYDQMTTTSHDSYHEASEVSPAQSLPLIQATSPVIKEGPTNLMIVTRHST